MQKIQSPMKTVRAGVLIILIMLLAWLPASAQTAYGASAPGIDAKITTGNVQKLLKKYDGDGAYIISKRLAAGSDILFWFTGDSRILDGIDTAVHEETHGYHVSYAKWPRFAYFVGNKQTVYVAHTKVYPSKKMAASIPKELRTFRYNTYVGKPSNDLSSNVNGAYGLLNEFMAYRSGMNTMISLYPYCAAQKADSEVWHTFVAECENNRLAYGEFKYYILHYLYYAKKHYPDVYRGILKNKSFCRAYWILESRYARLIRTYEADLKKMQAVFEEAGGKVQITDDTVWIYSGVEGSFNNGVGRFTSDYEKLLKEIKKSRYAAIHSSLVKNGK